MEKILQWFHPPLFEEDEKSNRARILHTILLAVEIILILMMISAPLAANDPSLLIRYLLFLFAFTVGSHFLLHRGHVKAATLVLLYSSALVIFTGAFITGGLSSPFFTQYILVILIAGLILGRRAIITYSILGAILALALAVLQTYNLLPAFVPAPLSRRVLTYITNFTLSAIIFSLALRNLREALNQAREHEESLEASNRELQQIRTSLEQKVAERTAQLRATVEIGRAISFLLDPDLLLREVVNLITDRFGFYHVAIYLIDEQQEWAVLRSASGKAGQKLLEEGHRLEIAGQNIIGTAINMRQPRIAFDVGEGALPFDSPLLPETRSEIAVPLLMGDRVLGALDVQSVAESAFNQEDIETLQSVANQIAVAFENARLFQETQQQLNEIERLNQLYLRSSWREIPVEQHLAFQFSGKDIRPKPFPDFTALEIAKRHRSLYIHEENGTSSVIMPIMVRDQIIGAIDLRDTRKEWTEDELTLIEAVATQAAMALENARLIQDTQRRVEQERIVSNVSGRIRETLNIETVLKTAAEEIRTALGLQEVFVQLTPPPPSDEEANGEQPEEQ